MHFPAVDYFFAAHKGYHAPVHVEALKTLGPSPIHRRGWSPIRDLFAGTDTEGVCP